VYTPFETKNPYDVHFATKMCDRTLAPAFFSRRDLPQHRADASVASARAWPMPERAGATSERRAASTSAAMPPRCIVSDRGGRVQAPCGRAPARTVDVVSIAPIDLRSTCRTRPRSSLTARARGLTSNHLTSRRYGTPRSGGVAPGFDRMTKRVYHDADVRCPNENGGEAASALSL